MVWALGSQQFLKQLNAGSPQILLLGVHPGEMKTLIHTKPVLRHPQQHDSQQSKSGNNQVSIPPWIDTHTACSIHTWSVTRP